MQTAQASGHAAPAARERPASVRALFDVRRTADFDFASGEYKELFDRSEATAFQHPTWLTSLYGRLAPQLDARPAVVTVRAKSDGRLVLVLPLLERRYGPFRIADYADLNVSDYSAPIYDRVALPAMLRDTATLKGLRRELAAFDVVRARKCRADGLFPMDILGSKTSMGFHAHAVPIRKPFDAWRAEALDAQFVRFLDKKRRLLGKKGHVAFAEVTSPEAIADAFDRMRAFRKSRFEGTDLLQQPSYFDFYVDVATRGVETGLCRTCVLSLDGKPLAGIFGLAHRQRFMFLLVGFDFGGYRNASLGLLVLEDLMRDCIERGDTTFDLTIGDEPYKKQFAAQPTPMFVQWRGSGPAGILAGAAMRGALYARSTVKEFKRRRAEKNPASPPAA